MTLINYIVFSLAIGIQTLVAMRNSAEAHPVALTRGLIISLILCSIYTIMLAGGTFLGNLFHFDYPPADHALFLGFFVLVIVKLLFSLRRTAVTGYDISPYSSAILAGIALGINILLLGIGIGFEAPLGEDVWKMLTPLVLLVLLMSMWGIMLGRKKIDIRPKRWLYISLLCLLVVALVG